MITENFFKKIDVKYSEMNFDKGLKPYALLNYLQDLASDNAEQLGFGYSYITPKNLLWFLLKYRIEFTEYPVSIYNLTLKTEPRGYNKLFAYRDFELYDGNRLLAKAASVWSLVDMDSKSLAIIEKVLDNPYMKKYEKREDDLIFEKIPPLTKVDLQKEFEVRYNDIDVNQHANNGNYIVWAFEPLGFEFSAKHKLKTLDINFKKEVKYGEKILSQIEFLTETCTSHVIKNANTNEDLCTLKCEWS